MQAVLPAAARSRLCIPGLDFYLTQMDRLRLHYGYDTFGAHLKLGLACRLVQWLSTKWLSTIPAHVLDDAMLSR